MILIKYEQREKQFFNKSFFNLANINKSFLKDRKNKKCIKFETRKIQTRQTNDDLLIKVKDGNFYSDPLSYKLSILLILEGNELRYFFLLSFDVLEVFQIRLFHNLILVRG